MVNTWHNHKQSLNNEKYKNSTSLCTHVWDLKEKGATLTLKWSIIVMRKATLQTQEAARFAGRKNSKFYSTTQKTSL